MGADDADGADGPAPGFSGAEKVWVVVILMVRVRARPSRSKPISMPILRRKVAARRSRPARARGASGQVFDLATRSPTTSARAPRRSEAVPVHTVRVTMIARTAVAIGSAWSQRKLAVGDALDSGMPKLYTPDPSRQKCSAVSSILNATPAFI